MIRRFAGWVRARWHWIAIGLGAGLAGLLALVWRPRKPPAGPPATTPEEGRRMKDEATEAADSTVEAIRDQVAEDKAAGRAKYGEP